MLDSGIFILFLFPWSDLRFSKLRLLVVQSKVTIDLLILNRSGNIINLLNCLQVIFLRLLLFEDVNMFLTVSVKVYVRVQRNFVWGLDDVTSQLHFLLILPFYYK